MLVPVYNEERTIARVLRGVLSLEVPLEVIVVDDGSTDGTVACVSDIDDSRLRLLQQPENRGKTRAIQEAIRAARGEVLVVQDADLEYDPSEIPHLIAPILEGKADVVYGSRFLVRKAARVLYYYHYVVNQALTTLSNLLTNVNLTDVETGYKAFRRELVRDLELTSDGFGLEIELTARLSHLPVRIYEVPISYYGRTYEEGKKVGVSDAVAAFWYTVYFNTVGRFDRQGRAHRQSVLPQLENDRRGNEPSVSGVSRQSPLARAPKRANGTHDDGDAADRQRDE